jgi:hypothetical protein
LITKIKLYPSKEITKDKNICQGDIFLAREEGNKKIKNESLRIRVKNLNLRVKIARGYLKKLRYIKEYSNCHRI